jgi:membrane fusion protein (multidrug efflux system)
MAIPIGGVAAPPKTVEPSAKVIFLHIQERGRERGVKVVTGADYVIGRSPGSDVVVEDDSCSGRHAIIYWQSGLCLVRDLESANGTSLNGEKILESEIRPGDVITVGRTRIEIAEEPLETDDADVLLKRTRLGMPVIDQKSDDGRSRTGATEPAPIPRWVLGAAASVVLLTAVLFMAWKMVGRDSDLLDDRAARTPAGPSSAVMVQTRPVAKRELSFTVSAAGTVNPQRQVTVSAEVPGKVVAVSVERGSSLSKGQEIIRLDDREIQLQIREAAASVSTEQVDLAREDYERKQRLFADGALTRSALDQSKNNYLGLDSARRSAQARIAQLKERAAKTRISAPLAGVVAHLEVEPGEFVGPGTPLTVIEDMTEVLVTVEVSDRDVIRLRPLQVVEATSDAYPGRFFSGVIERVSSAANPVTRSFSVEARIANPDNELRSGMIISLNIVLDKRKALVVPAEALTDIREGTARVFVVTAGTVREVEIGIGRRSDRDVEVLAGLSEGNEVVVSGHDRIREGQPVTTYRAD